MTSPSKPTPRSYFPDDDRTLTYHAAPRWAPDPFYYSDRTGGMWVCWTYGSMLDMHRGRDGVLIERWIYPALSHRLTRFVWVETYKYVGDNWTITHETVQRTLSYTAGAALLTMYGTPIPHWFRWIQQ